MALAVDNQQQIVDIHWIQTPFQLFTICSAVESTALEHCSRQELLLGIFSQYSPKILEKKTNRIFIAHRKPPVWLFQIELEVLI